jgi:pimeloyl-ACP methyl ester carboxylesterase
MVTDIRNKQGERIDFTFHPGAAGTVELAILGHGVTGNKDRPFMVALAETLAQAGLPTVRFSFSGNGESGGKFTESTITKEVEDLGSVMDAFSDRRVAYIGHSMGGAVGVIRAARDKRIQALVSLAGMVHTEAFANREFGMVRPGEGLMWDDPKCPLSAGYMEDMKRIHSVDRHAAEIHVPWLMVHGTADDVVPIQDSRDIFVKANQPKTFLEIENANHVFAGEHTGTMARQVSNWLEKRFLSHD